MKSTEQTNLIDLEEAIRERRKTRRPKTEEEKEYNRQWKAQHPGYDKAYKKANLPRILKQNTAYRHVHKDQFSGIDKRVYRMRKGIVSDQALVKAYGITPEEYNDMLIQQGGKCAICRTDRGNSRSSRPFDVDHCHETGKIRGLLCGKCNKGLGMFNDDMTRLELAAAYLQYHKTR